MNTYDNIHDAYLGTLADVLDNPDYRCAPRGQEIYEKVDYQFRVLKPEAVSVVTKDPERNKVIASYTAKEMELYNSCSNRVEDFARASKFWEKIANEDGTINSAYGFLIWKHKSIGHSAYELWNTENRYTTGDEAMRTPWEWSLECLKSDKDTRQAVMKFNLPEHGYKGVLDFPCTMHGNWHIREDRLLLSIVMRSNDLNRGLLYDISFFISLMDRMVDELKPTYPNLQKGHYTHTAQSAHIYEKEMPQILKMLGR